MACPPIQVSDQVSKVVVVLGLTVVWWACAVGVTVVLKAALGSSGGLEPEPGTWNFPFPLTLTLFANIGSAVLTGIMAYFGGGALEPQQQGNWPVRQEAEQFQALPGTTETPLFRASSREALLQDSNQPGAFAEAAVFTLAPVQGQNPLPGGIKSDLPGGSCGSLMPGGLLGSCGCWNPRRHRGAALLLGGMPSPEAPKMPQGQTPRESEMEASTSVDIISAERQSYPVYSSHGDSSASSPGRPSLSSCAPWFLRSCRTKGVALYKGGAAAALQERHTALIAMGVLQGLALGAKNEALLLLSVSSRTMIFSTNVLVVMILARAFGLERLKKPKVVAALLLATGGALQGFVTFQEMRQGDLPNTDEPQGYVLAIVALVLDALRWVLLQALFTSEASTPSAPSDRDTAPVQTTTVVHAPLSGGEESDRRDGVLPSPRCGAEDSLPRADLKEVPPKLSKLQMVSLVMWMTTPVCLFLSLFFEPSGIVEASRNPMQIFGLVALLTIGVMGINLCEFGVVQWTSAVTFNVLSQLHSIPLVLAGVTFFGEEISGVQVLGFLFCMLGALLYSFVKAREKRTHPPSFGEQDGAVENSVAAPLQSPVTRQAFV